MSHQQSNPRANLNDRVVVITGAAKGLGLEWVKQYTRDANTFVVASVRDKESAKDLFSLDRSNLVILELELTEFDKFDTTADAIAEITGGRIDLLINNAAVMLGAGGKMQSKVQDSDVDEWRKTYDINTISPVFFTLALLALFKTSVEKRIVFASTFLANHDLQRATDGALGYASYTASKAALNLAMVKLHHDLREDGFKIITLNPGWVRTGLDTDQISTSQAPLSTEQSVTRQKSFVDRLTAEEAGENYSLDGTREMITGA